MSVPTCYYVGEHFRPFVTSNLHTIVLIISLQYVVDNLTGRGGNCTAERHKADSVVCTNEGPLSRVITLVVKRQ